MEPERAVFSRTAGPAEWQGFFAGATHFAVQLGCAEVFLRCVDHEVRFVGTAP